MDSPYLRGPHEAQTGARLGRSRQQLADALDDLLGESLEGARRTHSSMGPAEWPRSRHAVEANARGKRGKLNPRECPSVASQNVQPCVRWCYSAPL